MKIVRILALLTLVAVVVLVSLATFGRPAYLRTRYHHWRNAEGLTALATAMLARQGDFDWIANVEGTIEAGSARLRPSLVNLDEKTESQFRKLFEEANTYYLNSSKSGEGAAAFLEISGGRRSGKLYWVTLLYNSLPRENRPACSEGCFVGDLGSCFVSLDERWIYELSWLDEDYKFPESEK
jgi:hypothetical protein